MPAKSDKSVKKPISVKVKVKVKIPVAPKTPKKSERK